MNPGRLRFSLAQCLKHYIHVTTDKVSGFEQPSGETARRKSIPDKKLQFLSKKKETVALQIRKSSEWDLCFKWRGRRYNCALSWELLYQVVTCSLHANPVAEDLKRNFAVGDSISKRLPDLKYRELLGFSLFWNKHSFLQDVLNTCNTSHLFFQSLCLFLAFHIYKWASWRCKGRKLIDYSNIFSIFILSFKKTSASAICFHYLVIIVHYLCLHSMRYLGQDDVCAEVSKYTLRNCTLFAKIYDVASFAYRHHARF